MSLGDEFDRSSILPTVIMVSTFMLMCVCLVFGMWGCSEQKEKNKKEILVD